MIGLLVVMGAVMPLAAQQQANPDFDPAVPRPAFASGEGPRILFDDAHNNFHTSEGRYRPFVRLMEADGFRVSSNGAAFSRQSLAGHDILVISSARGAPPGQPGQGDPAFTEEEADIVQDWVREGGALLLITDHPPAATPPRALAERFGIRLVDAAPRDSLRFLDHPGTLIFSQPHGALDDHPITRGRDSRERVQRVVTFTGNSMVPPSDGAVLLRLPPTALEGYDRPPAGDTALNVLVPARGTAQGVALTYGRGRVVALGEAAAWTSQNFGGGSETTGMDEPGFDNRQFILNVVRWLAGVLPVKATAWPVPAEDFGPAPTAPTYASDGPRVRFDAGHHNLFTVEGRFAPLAALLAADGYRLSSLPDSLTPSALREADVLVIAGPRGAAAECASAMSWLGSEDCPAGRAAFGREEIVAVEAWVREGGALLLAMDPFPSVWSTRELASAFGVDAAGGHALDWVHWEAGRADWVRFDADSGTVARHAITSDVRRALVFGAASLSIPDDATALLTFAAPAVELLPVRVRGDTLENRSLPIAGRAAAIAFHHGSGRVAVLGDADLLTHQQFEGIDAPAGLDGPPGYDNRRFTLNLFRWLTER